MPIRKASCGPSLIQTIDRAARHVEGVALLYADNMTDSMAKDISETKSSRLVQQTYNTKNGIVPTAAGKKAGNSILSFLELSRKLKSDYSDSSLTKVANESTAAIKDDPAASLDLDMPPDLIEQLEFKMKKFAKELNFEDPANLRDKINLLRKKLSGNK